MRRSIVTILIPALIAIAVLGAIVVSKNLIKSNVSDMYKNQISITTLKLINSIRNDDVKWDGTIIGIMPMELAGATLTLQDSKENINPLLVDALLDQDRFVAAHVLLTLRTPGPYKSHEGEWNKLKIDLYSDGDVSYEGNNLNELWRYWKEKLDLQ